MRQAISHSRRTGPRVSPRPGRPAGLSRDGLPSACPKPACLAFRSPDDRAGVPGFGLNRVPRASLGVFNKTLDLAKLQSIADAIVGDTHPNAEEAAGARRFRRSTLGFRINFGTSGQGAQRGDLIDAIADV